jgi:phage regulator Rha-like protein
MAKEIGVIQKEKIQNLICTIRNKQIMLDKDLAEMYQVETRVLNQAVKRNIDRFPEHFRFQLTAEETEKLVTTSDRFGFLSSQQVASGSRSQNVTLNKSGSKRGQNIKYLPFVFTEQGVAMLSAVLRSETAVKVSIQIMDAFVEMRKILSGHEGLLQRMDRFELKQADHDQKFDEVFKALEAGSGVPKQGIYFEGQTFDAFNFASGLIRSAKISIRLIDNYVDDAVLVMLAKRKEGVSATLYSKNASKVLLLDLKKHNEQYPAIELKHFDKSHDRFLIIDDKRVYHIGASLKDLGKKWFAFTELNIEAVTIIEKIKCL